jgi:hypothetical protein
MNRRHNHLNTSSTEIVQDIRPDGISDLQNSCQLHDKRVESGSYEAPVRFNKSRKSGDFNDFLDTFLKIRETIFYTNQTQLSERKSLYWPGPATSFSIPAFKSGGPPLMSLPLTVSFPLIDDPLVDCTIAYRGYVCKFCSTGFITPLWGFKETGKIVEPAHVCDRNAGIVILNDTYTDIGILNQKLLSDLKNVIKNWTKSRPCLAADLVSTERKLIDLTSSVEYTSDWVLRVINEGKVILSDVELSDFLKLSGLRSYGLIALNTKYGQKELYFMHIQSNSTLPSTLL